MNNKRNRVNRVIIVVIAPLSSLINHQLQKLNRVRQRAVVLNEKHDSHESCSQERSLDLRNVDVSRLKKGDYECIFAHLETLIF